MIVENRIMHCGHRVWMPALLILLALIFTLPYVEAGFFADDYLLVNLLSQENPSVSRLKGAWSAIDTPAFDNIWWKDSKLTGSFWRPLPSLVIETSMRLFGKKPAPLHVLGILLHCLVTLFTYRLALRLTDSQGLAFLAGLFYVTCEDHSMTVAWISTLSNLLCVLFILLSLLAHVNYLKTGRLAPLVGSLAALVLALISKETAVVAPIAIILLSFIMPRGFDDAPLDATRLRENWRVLLRKPATWMPAALILIAYLGTYIGFGFGNSNSLQYINPIAAPIRYLCQAAEQLPVMWLGTLSFWPPFVTTFYPNILPYVIAPGLIIFLAWIIALLPFRQRAVAVWAMLFYLIALLPHLTTDSGERGLYLPMVSASILLAFLAQTIGPIARRTKQKLPPLNRWTRIAGWTTVLAIILPGIFVSLIRPVYVKQSFSSQEKAIRTTLPHLEGRPSGNLVITSAPDMLFSFYCGAILEFLVEDPPEVWLLSAAPGKFTLKRTGKSSFVITTDRSGWIGNTMAQYVRIETDINPGTVFKMPPFTATVENTTDDGKDVLAVSFRFVTSFDDQTLTFIRWNGQAFEPLDVAMIPIGETVFLTDNPELWESMLQ